jgi:tape measure domain-containing protein
VANIRAGVAYVDVRLGSIDDLKNKMKAGIEDIGKQSGKQLGENIKKSTPIAPLAELGTKLDKELTNAFFKDAKQNFNGGFRALATGQFGTAKALFSAAGKDFSSAISSAFNRGVGAIKTGFSAMVSGAKTAGTAISNAFTGAWTKAQEFGKVLDKASQKMGFLSFQIQNFGILASAVFTAPIAGALGFATAIGIKTAAQIESATAALKFLLPKGYDVVKLLNTLKKIALESPIFDTADLITYTQKFTAAGVQINDTTRFLKAFSNIALVTGATTDEANRAIVAITQVFGKGKLQAEELNQQLGEAMPATLKLLRDQLHVTQPQLMELVKTGKITGEDLIKAFTQIGESSKFLKGAATGAETLNGVWQNFKESLQTQLGQFFLDNSKQIKEAVGQLGPALGQLIKDAAPAFLGLIDAFTKLVGYFKQAVDWYSKLSPGTQSLILKLVALGAALGPVVLVVGSLLGAFAGIAAGIAALLTPVGLVIAAIVAIGAAIAGIIIWYKKFGGENSAVVQSIKSFWNGLWDTVIGPVIDGFKAAWSGIVDAFNQIKNAIGSNTGAWKSWGGLLKNVLDFVIAYVKSWATAMGTFFKGLFTVIGYIFRAIGSIISGVIKIFKGLTDFLIGVFQGDWSRALNGLKEIWDGIWDAVYGTLANLSKALGNLVLTIYHTIVNFFKKLYDELVGHSIVPDMVRAIIAWFNKLISPIRNVLNSIAGFFSGFGAKIKGFVKLFAQGVHDANAWFAQLPGKIKNALSSLASNLYNFGKNAMQGFVNGLASVGQRAIDKAKDIANSVKNIVKGALGIGSPSKVFREYGRNVVQGFVLGITGEQSSLYDSLNSFSEKPRFQQINGSPAEPVSGTNGSPVLQIDNYYANDNVDPWRQAEDWYFLVTSRGGVA